MRMCVGCKELKFLDKINVLWCFFFCLLFLNPDHYSINFFVKPRDNLLLGYLIQLNYRHQYYRPNV